MPKLPPLDIENWKPKTRLGKLVKEGKIKTIDEILDKGLKIMEPEIVDVLLPDLEYELLLIGQRKGKFGGGKRTPYKTTHRKTAEGPRLSFSIIVVIGNKNGYIGIGKGKASEKLPALEKALKNARKNIFKIKRGCGSWECGCGEPHSIPFAIEGKCGSVRVKLMPAPKGLGLAAHDEIKKILRLAGIKDVWCKTFGQTRTRVNLIYATIGALKKLSNTYIPEEFYKKAGIIEGSIKTE